MRHVFVVLCAVGGFGAAAPVPKERIDAERVVGTWKMTRDARGNTDTDLEIEFQQGGKVVIRQRTGLGAPSVYEGTYRVVGDQLPYEVKLGGAVKKETLTIKKLTANELVTVDPDGLKEEFVRMKKPEPKTGDK